MITQGLPPPLLKIKKSRLAIWSLVLGLLPLGAVPAIICGHLAHRRIKLAGGALAGQGLALTGLILGYGGLAVQVLIAAFCLLTSEGVRYALQAGRYPLQHEYILELAPPSDTRPAANDVLLRTQAVMGERLRQAGIPHNISRAGQNRLSIQVGFPAGMTRDHVRHLVSTVGYLEFRLVHARNDDLVRQLVEKSWIPEGYRLVTLEDPSSGGRWRGGEYYQRDRSHDPPGTTEEAVRARLADFHAPPGYELLLEKLTINEQDYWQPYFVNKRAELTGENLKRASLDFDPLGRPHVSIQLDSKGSRRFWEMTKRYAQNGSLNENPNLPRLLGIVLDGTLYSAPVLRAEIPDGRAVIEGRFTYKEASDLALILNSGQLPAPLTVVADQPLGKRR